MCLATVYAKKESEAPDTVLLDKVQFIDVEGDELAMTNLFGEVVRIRGSLTSIDLNSSIIKLEVYEQAAL